MILFEEDGWVILYSQRWKCTLLKHTCGDGHDVRWNTLTMRESHDKGECFPTCDKKLSSRIAEIFCLLRMGE